MIHTVTDEPCAESDGDRCGEYYDVMANKAAEWL